MRFGVLGPLAVWTAGGAPMRIPETKVRALLAHLLVDPGKPVSTDALIDHLWGASAPADPLAALRTRVSQLRATLGRERVVHGASGYLLQVDADAVDATRFDALVRRARQVDDPRARTDLVTEALALWRGPAFADVADEPFARGAIVRLEELRIAAVEELAEARLALGEHHALAAELADVVARHPLRERLRGVHLRALYRAGRQGEALAGYEELRRLLADELGASPGAELAALHQAILRQDPAIAIPPRVPVPFIRASHPSRRVVTSNAGAPTPSARHTVSPHLTRLLLEAGVTAGLDRSAIARVPGLTLQDGNSVRIPTAAILRAWDLVSVPLREAGGSGRAMELWRPGSLGVWDYLFATADTLGDALRAGARHFDAIADPIDKVTVVRDDEGVTFSWDGPYGDHVSYPLIAEFVPSMLLTAAAWGAGRPLTPVSVGLPHRAPARHRRLIELYGTRRIDFDADFPSITFSAADAEAPLPRADPVLAGILSSHAQLTVATARRMLGWLDRFHAVLESAFAAGPPELSQVAHRLAMSPRTLQRRLRQEGTSWREEVDGFRQRRADQMLRENSLSVETIAARVGYSDPRALRRAVHRWYGHGPAAVRSDVSCTGLPPAR